ncbi:contact-dependent growth inhibition system immunity protein [Streptomyces sp. SR27]|uniref:contact-dependent growth inhibition system immunity protein n=1 Tax=unclassified Streptomyces TaxID=2593676 RepID=UPI00295AACAF|nr:contact-dependent growth inhibition system immunity protein [Streptomyces sp. SR27]MDV9190980.1 contact-dependent growth inhibition system immunity protein [Streptomyces sp. SR27]
MPLTPLQHDPRYGEMDQVLRAYAGQRADDTEEKPSVALTAYLRHTWHSRPWAVGIAESQLREYARNPPGPLLLRLGEVYPLPDPGLDGAEIQAWLLTVAGHLRRCLAEGDMPPPGAPQTRWEWQARFPELGQLLGGWFSQDHGVEFQDHEEALRDYLEVTDPSLAARLCGEAYELLALRLDESDYAYGLSLLGLEVDPPVPYTHGAWLGIIAEEVLRGR